MLDVLVQFLYKKSLIELSGTNCDWLSQYVQYTSMSFLSNGIKHMYEKIYIYCFRMHIIGVPRGDGK